jgi:hypothetical protein
MQAGFGPQAWSTTGSGKKEDAAAVGNDAALRNHLGSHCFPRLYSRLDDRVGGDLDRRGRPGGHRDRHEPLVESWRRHFEAPAEMYRAGGVVILILVNDSVAAVVVILVRLDDSYHSVATTTRFLWDGGCRNVAAVSENCAACHGRILPVMGQQVSIA